VPAHGVNGGRTAARVAAGRDPVHYGGENGPDLGDVARYNGLTEQRVVELHAAAEYLVYFVGFATCFPYLGGLPSELATPRLAAPRKLVPEGSVAIGGAQAGIYPLASPGGWRLIGRTHLQVVRPLGIPAAAAAHGGPRTLCARTGGAALSRIHVLAPGFLTTVQDLGRFGYAHFGVSASGAADALALRAGNLLVGNAENAAALEMTLVGGEFAFDRSVVISVTGSEFISSVPMWRPVEIRHNEIVRFGPSRSGARCYLSVRGGLDVPLAMAARRCT